MHVDDAIAAIDKLGDAYAKYMGSVMTNAEEMAQQMRAHIAALTAERDYTHGTNEVLRSENQRLEAERDALRAKVARLEGALTDMPKAVLRTTVCQGPQWPDDRPGVWLAALEACAKSVQAEVDAAFADGGKEKP